MNPPRPVVFDGQAQPNLMDNPHVLGLLPRVPSLTPAAMEVHARRPEAEGGFGLDSWFAAEQPLISWMGQEFNVRGHAHLVLRRRPSEHL